MGGTQGALGGIILHGGSAPPHPAVPFPSQEKVPKVRRGSAPGPPPRHRPPGDTPFLFYLPFAAAGLILPVVPALRLPHFCVYPRILTGDPAVAHRCGDSRHCACGPTTDRATQAPPYCAAIRSDPPCWLYPFKRPAGVQWPTATSNPKPPVAAHGRSCSSTRPLDQNPVGLIHSRGTAVLHLGACPKVPRRGGRPLGAAPSKGVQNRRFWRAFGYFSRVGKVTAGCGGAKPPLGSRHCACGPTTARAVQAPPWAAQAP